MLRWIEKEITDYDLLLVVLSKNSINSEWVEIEVKRALEKEKNRIEQSYSLSVLIMQFGKLKKHGHPLSVVTDILVTLEIGTTLQNLKKLLND